MDWATIIEACIITGGVVFAQIAIARRSQNLIVYRIDQLEKKQDKHNSLIERMVCVEQAVEDDERRIQELEKRVSC